MPAAAVIAIGAATAIAGGIMSYSAAQQAAQSQRDAAAGVAAATIVTNVLHAGRNLCFTFFVLQCNL